MNTATARTVNAGLVGFGLAGRVLHAPLIQAAGLQVRGVVTRRPNTAAALPAGAIALPDIDALLALPDLDVVVIATPNDQHEAQAIAALSAGKCVIVDKPLATDTAASARMLQAARRSTGSLTVFHNRRWDSDFLTVQRLIADQSLGAVHTYEARWNRFRPQIADRWREHASSGGGLLLDLGPHLIDQALLLYGLPDWVQADIQCRRPQAAVDDSFELRLAYGERRVVLGADSVTADSGPRFRLHGDRGSFTKHGLDVQEAQLRAGLWPLDPTFGVEAEDRQGVLVAGDTGQARTVPSERGRWIDFYRAVRAHVEHATPLPVDATQAHDGLRVIEAARRSAATGTRSAL